MISRERMLGAIDRKPIDRIPMMESYWGSTVENWRKQGLGTDISDIYGYFHQEPMNTAYIDWSFGYPTGIIEDTELYTITRSADNVKQKTFKKTASMLEISDFSITCRDDWEVNKERFIFNESRINIEAAKTNYENTKDIYIQTYMEPCLGFEKFKYCMGTQALLEAIAEDPEWIRDMVEATERLAFAGLDYCMDHGLVFDVGFITEDMGFSNGPFFSPAFYREIIMPSHKRWCDYLHSKGIKSMLHTCGDNRKLIPDFIAAGFDILNPLEQKAGMDLYKIKRDYGDKLTLWGGIDVLTISSNDENRLHEEIKNKVLYAKQGNGYIFGSDHSIPDNVDFSLYCKMVEWALEYGKY